MCLVLNFPVATDVYANIDHTDESLYYQVNKSEYKDDSCM